MAETYYAWDPVFDCILDETDASGAVVAEYTQEPKLYGGLISQKRGGATSYHHYDPVGTTRALTNQAQAVTDTAVYTAFGEKMGSTGTTVNPFGYSGRVGYYTNDGADNLGVRRRAFDTSIARWLSWDRDWILNEHFNAFDYVTNNPNVASDPSGLHPRYLIIDPETAPEQVPWKRFAAFEKDGYLTVAYTDGEFSSIDCPCVKCKACGAWTVEKCTGKIKFTIYIDTTKLEEYLRKKVKDPRANLLEQAYGHEQRHVKNLINCAHDAMKMVHKATASIVCKDESAETARLKCILAASKATLQAEQNYKACSQKNADHKNPEPLDGEPYPPKGPIPNPTE